MHTSIVDCVKRAVFFLCFIGLSIQGPILSNYDIWGDGRRQTVSKSIGDLSRNRTARVLNFFPVPFEEECLANDGRRKGACLNTYECRIQGGKSYGSCAIGFGVCCVFAVSCDAEVYNNITYFVNPDFPGLSPKMETCTLKVKKVESNISQFRLDFIHFHLGQPNRKTGICEDDVFTMTGGLTKKFTLCGLNSGQHVYYDVENMNEPISINMKFGKKNAARLWEIRVVQIPFKQRAPAGCLQYHTGKSGIIKTLNFAENGRRLANQDYSICMRQEMEMCSIAYEPCDENSFRIGSMGSGFLVQQVGNGGQPGGGGGVAGAGETGVEDATGVQGGTGTLGVSESPGNDVPDDEPGSGDGTGREGPSAMCDDKIVMPCDSEDFIMPGFSGTGGSCDIIHCGSSFCPDGEPTCRIETSSTPFTIGVQFGPGARQESPDDNLGMCLKYEQLPCSV